MLVRYLGAILEYEAFRLTRSKKTQAAFDTTGTYPACCCPADAIADFPALHVTGVDTHLRACASKSRLSPRRDSVPPVGCRPLATAAKSASATASGSSDSTSSSLGPHAPGGPDNTGVARSHGGRPRN